MTFWLPKWRSRFQPLKRSQKWVLSRGHDLKKLGVKGCQIRFFFNRLNQFQVFRGFEAFCWLVVSTHLKNISQNGNLPQVGMKIKNLWNHHLVFLGEQVVGVFLFLGLPWFWTKTNITTQYPEVQPAKTIHGWSWLDGLMGLSDSNKNPTKWAKFGRRFPLPGNIKRIDSVWELDYPVILRILEVL